MLRGFASVATASASGVNVEELHVGRGLPGWCRHSSVGSVVRRRGSVAMAFGYTDGSA